MIYLDTSAALKTLVQEAESSALLTWLADTGGQGLVAAWLLHTELHCALRRRPDALELHTVDHLLDAVELVDVTRGDLMLAPQVGGGLRTLDALHLAVALRLGVDTLVTYDRELAVAARSAGLEVVQPA